MFVPEPNQITTDENINSSPNMSCHVKCFPASFILKVKPDMVYGVFIVNLTVQVQTLER